MLEFYGLTSNNAVKLVGMSTDSANNMKKAVELIGVERVPCTAHAIHNMVQAAFSRCKDVADCIAQIKEIVTFFKQSTTAKCTLDEERALKEKPILSLLQSVCTRWNSEYYMLNRFYDLRSELSSIIVNFPKCPPMVSSQNLVWIPEVIKLLSELETLTSKVSCSAEPTSNIVIPRIYALYKTWDALKLKTGVAMEFRDELINQANSRLDILEKIPVLQVSTILDPRFKNVFFKNKMNGANAVKIIIKELGLIVPQAEEGADSDDEEDSEEECSNSKDSFF